MKSLSMSWQRISAVVFLLTLASLAGCSKKGQLVLNTTVFSSAPPELRQRWDAAAEYGLHRDYLGTATNLIVLLSKTQQLNADQVEAVNQAWLKLGNEAFEAANRGDKSATEAVLRMRETGFGERRGQKE